MLPVVAAMMMGAMSERASQPSAAPLGGGGDLLSMLSPVLDANRDGNVVDDIIGLAGKMFSGR
jgi:hypothetical protein